MLLDTSFIIDLLAGDSKAKHLAQEIDSSGTAIQIPTPVVFELWAGAGRALRSPTERRKLSEVLLAYPTVSFESDDAQAAGRLQAALRQEGRPMGTVDVQLAGMALARQDTVVTGDRDFNRVGHGVRSRSYLQP